MFKNAEFCKEEKMRLLSVVLKNKNKTWKKRCEKTAEFKSIKMPWPRFKISKWMENDTFCIVLPYTTSGDMIWHK